MHRLSRLKKALHLSKKPRNDTEQRFDPQPSSQSPIPQNTWNFSFDSNGVAGGYTCPSPTTCGLCHHFLSPSVIYQLFTKKHFDVGQTTDLFAWSQASDCPLCMYLCLKFVEASQGQIPLDARVIVRWNTRDTAVKGGRRDEIRSWDFELMSVDFSRMPAIRAWPTLLSCWTEEDQKIGYYMTTRPASLDVGAPAAFERAKSWLDECMHLHPKCQSVSPAASELPTRVLKISSAGARGALSICLYSNTPGEVASYAALSYVWGGPQTFRTLRSNVLSHNSQISLSTLPQTIQDAIFCTHKLGLQYLWVDSLCIIQDDTEDRDREIANMANIYKNAFVTISAAAAKSCYEGFLQNEGRAATLDLKKQSFKISIVTPKDSNAVKEWIKAESEDELADMFYKSDGRAPTISWDNSSVWHTNPSTIYLALSTVTPEESAKSGGVAVKDLLTATSTSEEIISSRGWTFQESWLSPRILSYGSSQLLFQCRTHIQSHGGLPPSDFRTDFRDDYLTASNGLLLYKDGTTVSPEYTKEIYTHAWRKIVNEASRRNLTSPADKLSSLAGIAQEIRRQTGYNYLAGFWRETLLSHLSWYQSHTSQPDEDTPQLNWTQARHCSSWTWIKTDGPISFSHAEHTSCQVLRAEILQEEMKIDPEDPEQKKLYVGGPLGLRAPISTLPLLDILPHFQIVSKETGHKAFRNTIFPDGGLETNPYLCFPKQPISDENGQFNVIVPPSMRFLELSNGKEDGVQNIAAESRGLVIMSLEQPGTEGVYRRIGFYVVALEESAQLREEGVVSMLMVADHGTDDVRGTAFGARWKESMVVEEVTIV